LATLVNSCGGFGKPRSFPAPPAVSPTPGSLDSATVKDALQFFPRWAVRRGQAYRSGGRSARKRYEWTKRFLDIAILIAALPLLLLVSVFVAICIKLEDGGPVLFRQTRFGLNGEPFRIFKFRTMVVDSELMTESLAEFNQVNWPEFLMTEDPRVTRTGRMLRRTSLDELPQVLNVALGQMSLIGPRASTVSPSSYKEIHLSRLDVIPGIAGPGHVWRRSENFERKCELDVAYVEIRSTLLDLYMIGQAIFAAASMPK
jgi:lipopolysaccharide/colanic/teichoic acid biosynthesis glycosyltransferase